MHRKKFVYIFISYGVVSDVLFLTKRLQQGIVAHPRKNLHKHTRPCAHTRTDVQAQANLPHVHARSLANVHTYM